MDLELRYIEGKAYGFDDFFWVSLQDYTIIESHNILNQISSVVPYLPILDGWSQELAGVIHGEEPKFFAIEYYNEESDVEYSEPTFFVDIKAIECEEYLEYISHKLSIKSYLPKNESLRNSFQDRDRI